MPGLLGDLFGGSDQSSSSGLSALPQWAQQAYQNAYNQAQGVSQNTSNYAPIPYNSTQTSALQGLAGGPPALGFTSGAQAAFGGAQNFLNQVPGQINLSNGYLNDASNNINQGTRVNSPQDISNSINSFFNPYIQDAINPAVDNINREADYQNSQIGQQAANAGAFGGTRQALAESELYRNTQQNVGQLAGQLYDQGYNTASSLGLQNLQNERQNFLTGAGLNIGQSSNALSGENAYVNGASALTALGNGDINGMNSNYTNYYNAQNQKLNAGNILQQPALQTQQIPFNQLQTLLSGLGILPNTSQGSGATQGGAVNAFAGLAGKFGGSTG